MEYCVPLPMKPESMEFALEWQVVKRFPLRGPCMNNSVAEFVGKKLCPDLIVVKLNFERYNEMSKRCMEIFRRYDPNMCPAGCDEGYLKQVLATF